MANDDTPIDIPPEIQNRLSAWYKLYKHANFYYYFFGILGVAASAISAAMDGNIAKVLSVISATSMAVLGFTQPDRKYIKFVRAWRILDIAAIRYRYRQIDITELLESLERGEKSITEFEQELSSKSAVKLPSTPSDRQES